MSRTLTNTAVGDDIFIGRDIVTTIDLAQFFRRLKGAIGIGCHSPGNALCARNMTTALGTLLRIIDHVDQFTGIFLWRAYIDQGTPWILQATGYIVTKSAYGLIHYLRMIRRRLILEDFLRHRTLFRLPLTASAIHDLLIRVTIHAEQPERIAGIPVVRSGCSACMVTRIRRS